MEDPVAGSSAPAQAPEPESAPAPEPESPPAESPPARRTRSKSPARTRRSRSRSRSRGRGRSKSPARQPRQARTSQSPARQRKTRAEPTTPVRRSARLEAIEANKDVVDGPAAGDAKMNNHVKPVVEEEKEKLRPAHSYEFGGPLGAFFMTLTLPAFLVLINDMCTKTSCDIQKLPTISRDVKDYFNVPAALGFFGFLIFQGLLAALPIGRLVSGRPLKNGESLKYRCNGLLSLVVTMLAFAGCLYMKVPVVDQLLSNQRQLMCTAITFSFIYSALLYIRGLRLPGGLRSDSGNTGSTTYDFFMGRELNPRIGPVDLKFFLDLRPSLIGWALLNMCMMVASYKADTGVPTSLALCVAGQMLYIADALVFEESLLSTMDITTEGLGFMLVFGNLAWVPFVYSLQTRYIFEHTVDLPHWGLALIVLLNLTGYLIFRGSNSQKDTFRRDPNDPRVVHLETVPTSTGKSLLVSGWWGIVQHPNYLGDLMMATSWSLFAGFASLIPYFYPIYMLILLIHRQRRDSAACAQKYGAAWNRYNQRVKYRVVPYVY